MAVVHTSRNRLQLRVQLFHKSKYNSFTRWPDSIQARYSFTNWTLSTSLLGGGLWAHLFQEIYMHNPCQVTDSTFIGSKSITSSHKSLSPEVYAADSSRSLRDLSLQKEFQWKVVCYTNFFTVYDFQSILPRGVHHICQFQNLDIT
jgi:hypothetical protein